MPTVHYSTPSIYVQVSDLPHCCQHMLNQMRSNYVEPAAGRSTHNKHIYHTCKMSARPSLAHATRSASTHPGSKRLEAHCMPAMQTVVPSHILHMSTMCQAHYKVHNMRDRRTAHTADVGDASPPNNRTASADM